MTTLVAAPSPLFATVMVKPTGEPAFTLATSAVLVMLNTGFSTGQVTVVVTVPVVISAWLPALTLAVLEITWHSSVFVGAVTWTL